MGNITLATRLNAYPGRRCEADRWRRKETGIKSPGEQDEDRTRQHHSQKTRPNGTASMCTTLGAKHHQAALRGAGVIP
jgi:hypothetical protein